jgi:hypothetical protein
MSSYGLERTEEYNSVSTRLPDSSRQPTIQERLDAAVKNAKMRLDDAEKAQDILSRNPDLEELLNIMQKGNF